MGNCAAFVIPVDATNFRGVVAPASLKQEARQTEYQHHGRGRDFRGVVAPASLKRFTNACIQCNLITVDQFPGCSCPGLIEAHPTVANQPL